MAEQTKKRAKKRTTVKKKATSPKVEKPAEDVHIEETPTSDKLDITVDQFFDHWVYDKENRNASIDSFYSVLFHIAHQESQKYMEEEEITFRVPKGENTQAFLGLDKVADALNIHYKPSHMHLQNFIPRTSDLMYMLIFRFTIKSVITSILKQLNNIARNQPEQYDTHVDKYKVAEIIAVNLLTGYGLKVQEDNFQSSMGMGDVPRIPGSTRVKLWEDALRNYDNLLKQPEVDNTEEGNK